MAVLEDDGHPDGDGAHEWIVGPQQYRATRRDHRGIGAVQHNDRDTLQGSGDIGRATRGRAEGDERVGAEDGKGETVALARREAHAASQLSRPVSVWLAV